MRLKAVLLVSVLWLLFAASASASTTYITVTSTADSTTGTCPSNTACNLRAAIAEANSLATSTGTPASVEIDLSGGTSYPITQGTLDVDSGLALTIEGSGGSTTIDASGNGSNSLIHESARSASDSLNLSYLSITGAEAAGHFLLTPAGSFSAIDVAFAGNEASAILFSNTGFGSTTVTLTDDTFSDDGDGGDDYIAYVAGEATLSGDSVTNSSGDPAVQVQGGGFVSGLTLQNLTGPALDLAGSQPYTVNGVTATGGTNATDAPIVSLADTGETPSTVSDLDVEGVTSDQRMVNIYGAWSTINDVTVANNTISSPDAGIELDLSGPTTAENWTIAHNTETADTSSPLAGGVALTGGSLALRFATIDGNSALGDADDLYATGSGTALSVGDSILNGSAAGGAQECASDSGATITSLGDNIDHAGTCLEAPTDQDGVDPVLGALTAHTGTNPAPNIEPLGYGSPAVDAVPLSGCPATDEDGDSRPVGSLCDAGAFESPLTQFGIAVTGAPATAASGTAVTYTVTAQNASATTPQSAVITDTLPAGAILSSATVSLGGAAGEGCSGTATITCPVGALRRGEQAVATITAVLENSGTNSDTASIASELPDADDNADTTAAGTVVSAPAGSGGTGTSTSTTPTGTTTTPTSTTPTSTTPASTTPTTATPTSTTPTSTTPTSATPTSTTPTSTTPTTTTPKGVTALSLSPARFTAKSGSTLTFTDGTAGPLKLTVTRSARGVRVGKQCVAPPAHAKQHSVACTRTITVGRVSVTAKAAVNHLHFSAKLAGRLLAPGTYTLHVGTLTKSFTILAAPKRATRLARMVEELCQPGGKERWA